MIPFNKPYYTGKEVFYINDAMLRGKIAGDGYYSKACETFFTERYGFSKTFLTTSCTDALEMIALLLNVHPGDEIIMPSYSFVSTANAFIMRGAKIIFVDSNEQNPNIDTELIEANITPATKAIVIIHYAGIACNMARLKEITGKYGIYLIEDAAQAIDGYYNDQPLGTFGDLAAFSFHETKNITCGEGGLLVVNNPEFVKRAEIIREKGTNRSAFFRGEVDRYHWVDVGSSFLPSDILAAFLYAQLEELDNIQTKRRLIWNTYAADLNCLIEHGIKLPAIPDFASNNAHIFYLIFTDLKSRTAFIAFMKANGVQTVYHYLSLNDSPYYTSLQNMRTSLPMEQLYQDCLVRLPMFYDLEIAEVNRITQHILAFFKA